MKNAARPNLSKLHPGQRVVVRDGHIAIQGVVERAPPRAPLTIRYTVTNISMSGKAWKSTLRRAFKRSAEGVEWARGWDTEAARAFIAAVALS